MHLSFLVIDSRYVYIGKILLFNSIRSIFILFIVLAFVGQGLLSDGHWMISEASAHDMSMMQGGTNTHMAKHSACQNQIASHQHSSTDEHSMQQDQHCQTQKVNKKSCCKGEGMCLDECKHCVVITVAAGLMIAKSWPGFNPSQRAMAIPMPHFHSIAPTQALRPPIQMYSLA